MVKQWKAEAARQGRPLKLPTSRCLVLPHRLVLSLESVPFMLRNIWTAGLLLFATVMGTTFFITAVWQVSGRRGRCQTDRLIGYDRYRSRRYMLGHRLLGVSVPSLCIDDLADSTAAVRSRKYIQSHGDPTDERDASRSIIMEVRRSHPGMGPKLTWVSSVPKRDGPVLQLLQTDPRSETSQHRSSEARSSGSRPRLPTSSRSRGLESVRCLAINSKQSSSLRRADSAVSQLLYSGHRGFRGESGIQGVWTSRWGYHHGHS